LITEHVNMSGS